MTRSFPAALACLALLAGCGDDDDADDTAGGGETTAADATAPQPAPDLVMAVGKDPISFDKKAYRASAGEVTIEFTSRTRVGHNVRLQPAGKPCCTEHDIGGTETASDGQTITGTVTLKPGRYIMYCSIGGHWQRGMRAKLTVD